MTSILPEHDPQQDLVLVVAALHAACTATVTRRMAEAGFGDVRPSHGYVFQHLLVRPMRISELAQRLGMTPQGASKMVIELESLGYVHRQQDATDQRSRYVALTERGLAAIEAGRRARAALTAELRAELGAESADQLLASLQRLAASTGGWEALLARRLRPEA